MRHIVKGGEPAGISTLKSKANEDWKPSYDDLSGTDKGAIKRDLLSEQSFLCALCEGPVPSIDECSIEHLIPRSVDRNLELEYGNMVGSCISAKPNQRNRELHCNDKGINWYDPALFVSPLDPDCGGRFEFDFNGGIKGRDVGASKTIDRYGLDDGRLKVRRKAVLDAFVDQFEEVSIEDILIQVEDRLAARGGVLAPFPSAVKYCVLPLLTKV